MQKEIKWLFEEKYDNKPTKQINKDIERLKAGEPLDYVIGFTEFLGCKIDLSKKPLIPRSETEFWVKEAIDARLEDGKTKKRCLDLFSGSGCIGVAILKNVPFLLCDIADSQTKCLEQTKINLCLNGINKRRYRIIKSNVFSNIIGKYDFIFANPPYIPDYRRNPSAKLRAILRNRIQKSVLNFEPKIALFGGKDGFFYIRKFLKDAKKHINNGGRIFMEFSPEQKKEIEKIITRQNFPKKNLSGQEKYKYSNYKFCKDQYNRWRWVVVFK